MTTETQTQPRELRIGESYEIGELVVNRWKSVGRVFNNEPEFFVFIRGPYNPVKRFNQLVFDEHIYDMVPAHHSRLPIPKWDLRPNPPVQYEPPAATILRVIRSNDPKFEDYKQFMEKYGGAT